MGDKILWVDFQMWPDLIEKAKEGGLDVIQTYVFWNGHEPSPGKVIRKNKILFIFTVISPFFLINLLILILTMVVFFLLSICSTILRETMI